MEKDETACNTLFLTYQPRGMSLDISIKEEKVKKRQGIEARQLYKGTRVIVQ